MEASRHTLPEDLGPVLEAIAREQCSGSLRICTTGKPMRTFFFRDGRLIFACSSRPDVLTNLLVESGHRDLVAQSGHVPLSFLIPDLYAVSPDVAPSIVTHLAETFLWDSGTFIFTPDDPDGDDRALPVDLDLAPILQEGRKRRERWKSALSVLRDPTARYRRVRAWPERFPRTSGDEQLAAMLEGGSSLVDVLCAFRDQEYGVMLRIASLVRMRVLEPATVGGEVSAFPRGEFTKAMAMPADAPKAEDEDADEPMSDPDREALSRALQRMEARDYLGAYRGLVNHFGLSPAQRSCIELLQLAEELIVREAREAGLEDDVALRLAVPINQFVGRTLDPVDAFVLSRFAAGPRTVGRLLEVCPMPTPEVLATVKRFLDEGSLRAA